MDKIFIIGSGASGVHIALSLLQKKYRVTMLDVGYQSPKVINPQDNFNDLKNNLKDPIDYFLGKDFEAVILPDHDSEYYGFPPNKKYIFKEPEKLKYQSSGFSPLFSFAQGGLAEAWTGGVYPLNEDELKDFPFSYKDIEPYYAEIAKRIGICGAQDDLTKFFPFHENIMTPLCLDDHSMKLLSAYEKKRHYLNDKLKIYMGRSRYSTLSSDMGRRQGCSYSGRCLWGCPIGALYTPALTLKKCHTYPNFQYISDIYVTHFRYNLNNQVTQVAGISTIDDSIYEFPCDKLILAAGTLSSSKIFMESIFKDSRKIVKLSGLMDNRQILLPFINLNMMCRDYEPKSYQFHQLAIGIGTPEPVDYIHGQITTLKTALIHPIIQAVPLDLKTSSFLFRNIHSTLGVININLPDHRRKDNYVTLSTDQDLSHPSLKIKYIPMEGERNLIVKAIKLIKKAILRLGCIVPPGMTHIRPMGSSVHYSGTLPMSEKPAPYTTSEYCQSHDFENLFIVDGSVFPFLPAKNLTFTLMANAIRIAEKVF